MNHTHLQLVEKLCKWCGLSCLMTTCRARCHLRRFPGCSAPPQHHLSLSPCPAGAQTCLKRQLRILVQHPARMASLSSPCPLAALLCMPCPAGRPLTGQLALSRYALSSILSCSLPLLCSTGLACLSYAHQHYHNTAIASSCSSMGCS